MVKNIHQFCLLLCLIISPCLAFSQLWDRTEKLGTQNQKPGDNLGISTAISDSFMLAGAWWAEAPGPDLNQINSAGAAYMYQKKSDGRWHEIQKFTSPNPEPLGYFGFRVALKGDYAFIGAYNEDHSGFGNAGNVYAYKRDIDNHWNMIGLLQAPVPANNDYFGYDVSLTDGYVLIGAYNHDLDENGQNPLAEAGAAYLFQLQSNDTYTLIQKLVSPDRKAGDEFGRLVDIDEKGLVIGVFQSDGTNSILSAGSAYAMFCEDGFSNWTCDAIQSSNLELIIPTDQNNFEDFGWDVAMSGEWIVVGKSSESDQPGGGIMGNTGAAYFFKNENGQWSQKQKVYASDFKGNTFFGRCIGIDGDRAVIGAGSERFDEMGNHQVNGAGAAYIFELQQNNQWQEVQKIVGTQRNFNDLFAEDAVGISGNHIVIGAWLADTISNNELIDGGAVYIFERENGISTGLEKDVKNSIDISISPNPSSGILQIASNESITTKLKIEIFSPFGFSVYINNFSSEFSQTIDLSHVPNGIYIIRISDNKQSTVIQKWIKN